MTREMTATCQAVVERLVDPQGAHQDDATAAHVRSCMSCFRVMTELRDLPRLAEALRAAAPVSPAGDDRFWDALASRTTAAVDAALQGTAGQAAPRMPAPSRAARTWRTRVVSAGALAVAAAAGWMLMVRQPAPDARHGSAPAVTAASEAIGRLGGDEAGGTSMGDVAQLDPGALRQLLDRLGHHAPAALAGTADGNDGADVPADDEPRVNDELAELDGDALRRVASSLERAAF